jgi:hypothetical protein
VGTIFNNRGKSNGVASCCKLLGPGSVGRMGATLSLSRDPSADHAFSSQQSAG